MKVTVKYAAGHSYDELYERAAEIFCPHCGKQTVWVEQGPGDYYVGEMHVCVSCRWSFHMPSYGAMTSSEDQQRIEQLTTGDASE